MLDDSVAITAYRVMQECLTNIAKHAHAHSVNINVAQDDKRIYMDIEDDGAGFDQTKMTNGYGLAGMRERIQGLLGEMHIETSIGFGTKIQVILPKQSSLNNPP